MLISWVPMSEHLPDQEMLSWGAAVLHCPPGHVMLAFKDTEKKKTHGAEILY